MDGQLYQSEHESAKAALAVLEKKVQVLTTTRQVACHRHDGPSPQDRGSSYAHALTSAVEAAAAAAGLHLFSLAFDQRYAINLWALDMLERVHLCALPPSPAAPPPTPGARGNGSGLKQLDQSPGYQSTTEVKSCSCW